MWKSIFILIVFNSNTQEFESSTIKEFKGNMEYNYIVAHFSVDTKQDNLKFIKIIKDSVYIPMDSCYTDKKNEGLPYPYLKK